MARVWPDSAGFGRIQAKFGRSRGRFRSNSGRWSNAGQPCSNFGRVRPSCAKFRAPWADFGPISVKAVLDSTNIGRIWRNSSKNCSVRPNLPASSLAGHRNPTSRPNLLTSPFAPTRVAGAAAPTAPQVAHRDIKPENVVVSDCGRCPQSRNAMATEGHRSNAELQLACGISAMHVARDHGQHGPGTFGVAEECMLRTHAWPSPILLSGLLAAAIPLMCQSAHDSALAGSASHHQSSLVPRIHMLPGASSFASDDRPAGDRFRRRHDGRVLSRVKVGAIRCRYPRIRT